MGNSLLDIQPNVVSRDLRGYSFFFYGDAKTGKTTIASKFPKSLLLAYEIGFSTIPGIKPRRVISWSDTKTILRELEDPKVKDLFDNVIIDTVDIAYELCEKYICNTNDKDTIGDFGFGKGYKLLAKEFDSFLRKILQLGYGLILISHAKERTIKVIDGDKTVEYSQFQPTIDNQGKDICERTCDVIGYAREVEDSEGNLTTKLFVRGNNRFQAGSRFKYMPEVIDFNFQSLTKAVYDAIEKEAQENDNAYVTDEKTNLHVEPEQTQTFAELKQEFDNLTEKLISEDENWVPKIRTVIIKYLGRDKAVADCTESQFEALSLIVEELKTF